MRSFDDWASLVSFFQLETGTFPSFDHYCKVLSKCEASLPSHFKIIEDLLSWGFVMFPKKKHYVAIHNILHRRKLNHQISLSLLDDIISPFILASFSLQQRLSNAVNVVRKLEVSSSKYGLLALLYQVVRCCNPIHTIDLFFTWNCVIESRLFTGAWKYLFHRLSSVQSLHVVFERLPSLPPHLRLLYSKYLQEQTAVNQCIHFQSQFVDVWKQQGTLFIVDKTQDECSITCQRVAFNYFIDCFLIHSVSIDSSGLKTSWCIDDYSQLINNLD
ncbi:hypothetical protein RCL1_005049 [Eukaryota sp. TZLM3-RCL]